MNRPLYYYHKDSGLEIDFITSYQGEAVLFEVKATIRSVFSDFVYRTGVCIPEDYYDEHYYNTLKKTCSKIYTAPIPYCWNLDGNWIMFYESDEGDNFWL